MSDDAAASIDNIRLAWIAQPDACVVCRKIADAGPYAMGTLRDWPGSATLRCKKKPCRCVITAYKPDWDDVFHT